jgi:hypothetical protein
MSKTSSLFSNDQMPDVADWAEIAEYKRLAVPAYQGNPLIESLPLPPSENELVSKLAHYPQFDPSCRDMPSHTRREMISMLPHLFQPMNLHIDLYWRFARAIRSGYVNRDMFATPSAAGTRRTMERSSASRANYALARGFYLIGMTGMGKTISTERILSLYPQVIWHNNYRGHAIMTAQIPWLTLECPHDSSVKSVCLRICAQLDRLLGTDYYALYTGNGRYAANRMMIHIAFLCDLLKIGVLVIDEIQRVIPRSSGGAAGILNFFISLSNMIRVPVVLIGTFEAMQLFTRQMQQIRRGTQQGNVLWTRLEPDDSDWRFLLKAMWKYQYTRHPVELTPELERAMYYASQGIIDLAATTYMLAQDRAITSGIERITPQIIYSVVADSMQLASQPLNALRTGVDSDIQQYQDLAVPRELQDSYQEHPVREQPSDDIESESKGSSHSDNEPAKKEDEEVDALFRIPKPDDLRNALIEDSMEETFDALESAGNIGSSEAYIPRPTDHENVTGD